MLAWIKKSRKVSISPSRRIRVGILPGGEISTPVKVTVNLKVKKGSVSRSLLTHRDCRDMDTPGPISLESNVKAAPLPLAKRI